MPRHIIDAHLLLPFADRPSVDVGRFELKTISISASLRARTFGLMSSYFGAQLPDARTEGAVAAHTICVNVLVAAGPIARREEDGPEILFHQRGAALTAAEVRDAGPVWTRFARRRTRARLI